MQVIILGTNGWYDTDQGSTVCVLLRSGDAEVILDAGLGIHKVDQFLTDGDDRPVYLFLSHFHLDHIYGLHLLAKFRFSGGLTICGPAGTAAILARIVEAPFTLPLRELPYPVRVLELPRDKAELPFPVEARELRHSTLTLGYRIRLEDRTISYCPDTGYCENAVLLARAADLLITECAFPAGMSDENWPHLNPETAARIAREGQARSLVLVHFDASLYRHPSDRREAEAVARAIFPCTTAAEDGMILEV